MAETPTIKVPQVAPQATRAPYQSDAGGQLIGAISQSRAQGFSEAGAALGSIGGAMVDAQTRIAQRNNAVARATDLTNGENAMRDGWLGMKDTADIADPKVVSQYNLEMQKQIDDIVSNHSGGEPSKQALRVQLEAMRGNFLGQASVEAAQAGKAKVKMSLGTKLSSYVAEVYEDPSKFGPMLERYNADVANYADAMTETEQELERAGARAALKGVLVESMLAQPGGSDKAVQLASQPGFWTDFTVEQQQALRSNIQAVVKAEAEFKNKTVVVGNSLIRPYDGAVIYTAPQKPDITYTDIVDANGNVVGQRASNGKLDMLPKGSETWSDIKDPKGNVVGQRSSTGKLEMLPAKDEDGEVAQWKAMVDAGYTGTLIDWKRSVAKAEAEGKAEGDKAGGGGDPTWTDVKDGNGNLIGQRSNTGELKMLPANLPTADIQLYERAKSEGYTKDIMTFLQEKDQGRIDYVANKNMASMNDLAPIIAGGGGTLQQKLGFTSALTDYINDQTNWRVDPESKGLSGPQIPAHIRAAAKAAGIDVDAMLNMATKQVSQQTKSGDGAMNDGTTGPTKQNAQQPQQPAAAPQEQLPQQPAATQPKPGDQGSRDTKASTFGERVATGNFTGAPASFTEHASSADLTGELWAGASNDIVQLRTDMQLKTDSLINALAEARGKGSSTGEGSGNAARENLKKELSVEPSAFVSTQKMLARMVGIDAALRSRLETAKSTISNPEATAPDKQSALQEKNAIENFLIDWLPTVAKNQKDAEAWYAKAKPGDVMMYQEGQTWKFARKK